MLLKCPGKHTHTHTHTEREREREREKPVEIIQKEMRKDSKDINFKKLVEHKRTQQEWNRQKEL